MRNQENKDPPKAGPAGRGPIERMASRLAVKVAAFAVVPLVLFALVAGALGLWHASTFSEALSLIIEESESIEAVDHAVIEVESDMMTVLESMNEISLVKSQVLFSENSELTDEVEATYERARQALRAFRQDVIRLEALLGRTGQLEGEDGEMDARRMIYLSRTSETILRLFEIASESNRRTMEAVASGDLEAARNNFLFEETARMQALFDLTGKTMGIVTGMVDSVSHQSISRIQQQQSETKSKVVFLLQAGVAISVFSVLLFAFAGLWLAVRNISTPIVTITSTMAELTRGNLEVEVPGQDRADEIGTMAKALQYFRSSLIENERMRAEKALRLSEDLTHARQQLHDAVESISEGFALWDADDRLIMCNQRYRNLYPKLADILVPGASFADFLRAAYERGIFSLRGKDMEVAVREQVARHQTSVSAFEQELGDGRWIRVSKRKTKSGHTVGILSDITTRVESEATIRRMAMEDPLTGLPNRAKFTEQLQAALDQADRTGRKVGVMLLDLDHFKNINDTLGHAAGDELLKQVSGRIRDCLRRTDSVARLGGDEFAVISTNAQAFENIHRVGQRLIESLARPFIVEGKEIHTGTSIGVTIYPDDPGDQGQLLRNADLALYKAKEDGRGNCWLFDERLHLEMQARSTLERDLRDALAENQFFMVYQPQFDIRTGEIVGAESLIRWRHPERGLISPGEFIPVAESTRQIIPISDWVIRHVCGQLATWAKEGLQVPKVSVNISPLHFRQEDLVEHFERALKSSGVDPQRLEIEITESLAMAAGDSTLATLNRLKAMGVGLSIDDFGTGYSSLSRLKDFPVDRLKIDQSFIRNASENDSDAAISSAVIQLGHTLNLRVIAEGAETREQIELLASAGCDEVQGFYLSKPLTAEDFEAFVGSYQPKPVLEPERSRAAIKAPTKLRRRA